MQSRPLTLRVITRVTALLIGVAILLVVFLAGRRLHDDWRFRDLHDRARTVVLSLQDRCPDPWIADWVHAVEMTADGIANCFSMLPRRDWDEYARFVKELERRTQEDVTWNLIDWIWDEIERFGVNGKQYSAKWRPKRPEKNPGPGIAD